MDSKEKNGRGFDSPGPLNDKFMGAAAPSHLMLPLEDVDGCRNKGRCISIMSKSKTDKEKLKLWQERLASNQAAFSDVEKLMDERESLYKGNKEIKPLTAMDTQANGTFYEATHVRNIVAENIESEVDSNIPQPKVTARRKEHERLATFIENMIRNELDRIPFEEINDMMERTVPIQGGGLFLVEWDNTMRTHTTVGEVVVSPIHPKQVVPQDGVYTGIEDMDYIILKVPQTKEYISRRYKVEVFDEGESEPEVKSSKSADAADDMVTQYIAYYRNDKGGIGIYSWVNDVELENLDDYQARRLPRCTKCGAVKPLDIEPLEEPTIDGTYPMPGADKAMVGLMLAQQQGMAPQYPAGVPLESDEEIPEDRSSRKGLCPYCGNDEFEDEASSYEEIYTGMTLPSGKIIPPAVADIDGSGMAFLRPTKIPFYKPNVYPLVLQKNVSVYGQFLGDSDVDKIKDQQNTTNRLSKKIIDRLIKAGTRITLPDRADFRVDPEDSEKWYIGNASDKQLIDIYEFKGDLEYELIYLNQVYEEARQELGITDSFQGRRDNTATSGVAKEFSAAQAAGRLESKRVMKDAAYARLFELIFKFWLAYSDEPRTVVSKDDQGNTKYDIFDRYEFLLQDSAGQWYWNDHFLFSCDGSAPLANNRAAMWQETTAHLQAGAYGDPGAIDTLILYWTKMDLLHYPGAGETKAYLEKKLEEQQAAAMQMQKQLVQQQLNGGGPGATRQITGAGTALPEAGRHPVQNIQNTGI